MADLKISAQTLSVSPARTSLVAVSEGGVGKAMSIAQILGLIATGDIPGALTISGTNVVGGLVSPQYGGTGANLASAKAGVIQVASDSQAFSSKRFGRDMTRISFEEEFDKYTGSASQGNPFLGVSLNTGTLANISTGGVDTIGVWQLSTFTSSTGGYYIAKRNYSRISNGIIAMKVRVQVPTLAAAGTEEFIVSVGLTSLDIIEFTTAKPTVGIFLEYDRALRTNWNATARSAAGTHTQSDLGVAVTAGAWFTCDIEINAAGTSAVFTPQGGSPVTVSTNLPATSQVLNFSAGIQKSVGTTARTLWLDKFGADVQFTAARE